MIGVRSLELVAREATVLQRLRERLPSYLLDLREDPRWLAMFLLARTTIGRHLAWRRRPPTAYAAAGPAGATSSLFDADPTAIAAALRQDGLFRGLHLPGDVTAAIVGFAETTPCFGNHDRRLDRLAASHLARQDRNSPVTSGHYFERVHQCPAIGAVAGDKLLHDAARHYLGPAARLASIRLWWSFPVPPARYPARRREMLHFDLDDWRMLKFFFYLTPVDEDAGPHLFVRGSHRGHSLRHQFALTVGHPFDAVLATYGAERLVPIHGPAGTGFAEDPFGFHTGSLARTAPRLMLEVGFGVTRPSRRRFFGERIVANRPFAPTV